MNIATTPRFTAPAQVEREVAVGDCQGPVRSPSAQCTMRRVRGGSGLGHRRYFTGSQLALRIEIQNHPCCTSHAHPRHRSRRCALCSLSIRTSTSDEDEHDF